MDADVVEKPSKTRSKKGRLTVAGKVEADKSTAPASIVMQISSRPYKIVLFTSPKGGVGKTTGSRHVAATAAQAGLRVATLDLDPQKTLTKWWGNRPDNVAPIDHYACHIRDGEKELADVSDIDLLVIDTPTSVEEYQPEMKKLLMVADFVLIPTGHTEEDRASVMPWMTYVKSVKPRSAFLLNRVKRNTKSFNETRRELLKVGRLVPTEIPDLQDIPSTTKVGLSVVEVNGLKGADEFSGLWNFLREELGM